MPLALPSTVATLPLTVGAALDDRVAHRADDRRCHRAAHFHGLIGAGAVEGHLNDLVLLRVAGVVDLELIEEVVVEARDAGLRFGGREKRPAVEHQRDAIGARAGKRVHVRHVHRRIQLDVGRVLMVRGE